MAATLLFMLSCVAGSLEVPVSDPFQVPEKEGYNIKGLVIDENNEPVSGVAVSDGLLVTTTDSNGWFWLKSDLSKRRFVQVTVPAEYEIESVDGLPCFFQRIPEGAAKFHAEFVLKRRDVVPDRYTVFMVADPQIRDRIRGFDKFAYHSIDMFEDLCRDLNDMFLSIADRPVYGISLGDLIHEDVNMWDIYRQGIATLYFPMFGVIGNHDHYGQAGSDMAAAGYYEDNIGPTNYSFDLGKLHFVCLDNIIFQYDSSGNPVSYKTGLTDDVYAFLCNDLKHVPKDKTVMICSHSPMLRKLNGDPADFDVNGNKYSAVLSQYRHVHAWAGHNHVNYNYVYSENESRFQNMESHVVARSTGALWLNEWVNSDGTPRGYYVVDVDGEEVSWYFHPTGQQLSQGNGYDDSYQMRVYPPGTYDDGFVYANVWGWDELWGDVMYRDAGKPGVSMERITTYDDAYRIVCDKSNAIPGNAAKQIFEPDYDVRHIFRIMPSPGATSCTVEVKDRFGRSYSETMEWSR